MNIKHKLRLIKEGYSIDEIDSKIISLNVNESDIDIINLFIENARSDFEFINETALHSSTMNKNSILEQIRKFFLLIKDKIKNFFALLKKKIKEHIERTRLKLFKASKAHFSLDKTVKKIKNTNLQIKEVEVIIPVNLFDTEGNKAKVFSNFENIISKIYKNLSKNTINMIIAPYDQIDKYKITDDKEFLDKIVKEAIGVNYDFKYINEKIFGPEKKITIGKHNIDEIYHYIRQVTYVSDELFDKINEDANRYYSSFEDSLLKIMKNKLDKAEENSENINEIIMEKNKKLAMLQKSFILYISVTKDYYYSFLREITYFYNQVIESILDIWNELIAEIK